MRPCVCTTSMAGSSRRSRGTPPCASGVNGRYDYVDYATRDVVIYVPVAQRHDLSACEVEHADF